MDVGDQALRRKLTALLPRMNEQQRRVLVAAEARSVGRGGIQRLARLTGMSRQSIYRGLSDLEAGCVSQRVRIPGGGRKRLREHQPDLVARIESLIEPNVRGDPQSPLRWTTLSTRKLEAALQQDGRQISYHTVANLLHELDYTLQGNRKGSEGTVDHPQRDAQFRYISEQASSYRRRRVPVISVDTKKKELVGAFKNGGRRWLPKGKPDAVSVHDFPHLGEGKAIPYGAYDIARDRAVVNVGVTHDTAEFAVESIRRWWRLDGKQHYRGAKRLLICADSGGSNGNRQRAWKLHLQALSDETGMAVTVCHYPPGTSKWNKIEHRLFSFISLNWRGKPLLNFETVINLIGGTRTRSGLKVKAILDTHQYETGVETSDDEIDKLRLKRHKIHPNWNYTLLPRDLVP